MRIIHVSAECYPVAKVGGLADVVGALPKYQNRLGANSSVIMPFYNNSFTSEHQFEVIYTSSLTLRNSEYPFDVLKLKDDKQDFDIYFVDEKQHIYKDYVYSSDDTDRFLIFQIAVMDWLLTLKTKPNYIHCHDHHTGLIPFMAQESFKYEKLNKIPVITTIHNAQYQGWFGYENLDKIPQFNLQNIGLLDWNGIINSLAAAIKCAWRVTTVSPNYMEELKENANGLENLLRYESGKCVGVLNGIDAEVWNTETDSFLIENYTKAKVQSGKKANKEWICKEFNLDKSKPLFVFIGRLVGEKGAELLPQVFYESLKERAISILLLGSGFKEIEEGLDNLKTIYPSNYNAYIGYNEKLSHILYAGADFLLMPSRVEPCGLNQMYALRYGTVPIVRSTGGLKDTVTDIKEGGFGFCHNHVSVEDVVEAINRAKDYYNEKPSDFRKNRKTIMNIDHSWEASAKTYIELYKTIK
ncbi:glycogen/starch synthase [Winogradskyella sp. SYSU M77433]|uniref:glycogen synthase n=1 Tax=Winogradskyella sp. SYSU M77433 TaxID=3042722 RepID=UPI002480B2E7|nr:glycogen/starch synthase [Winogradskyella sp. SYSU M77433]MDH7912708.1 glycogen/starch synthase [Winogradskyella sp. SYSU M77433]